MSRVSFQTVVRLRWEDILIHLPARTQKTWNRVSLLKVFSNSVASTFKSRIQREGSAKLIRMTGRIDSEVFGYVVRSLVARRILRVVAPPKYVKQQSRYWEVTAAGLKR